MEYTRSEHTEQDHSTNPEVKLYSSVHSVALTIHLLSPVTHYVNFK